MSATTYAFCFASGEIAFGPRVPKGALAIAKGREDVLRDLICAAARHAYDNVTLLVPGIPEAPNQIAAVDALMDWGHWLAQRETESVEILCGRKKPRPPVAYVATGSGTAMPVHASCDGEG